MTARAIVVVALASAGDESILGAAWQAGPLAELSETGAPYRQIDQLLRAETPSILWDLVTQHRRHLNLWQRPLVISRGVNVVALEMTSFGNRSVHPVGRFLTLHLNAASDQQLASFCSSLFAVHSQSAQNELRKLPIEVHPDPTIRRSFIFLAPSTRLVEYYGRAQLVEASPHTDVGFWVHGRLAHAAVILAAQMSNQLASDSSLSTERPERRLQYISQLRDFHRELWWPDFSLDSQIIGVAQEFYETTGLKNRVREDRETVREILSELETSSARLLNRVGLVLGSSAVVASWIAAKPILGWVWSCIGGALTVGVAATSVMHLSRHRKRHE